MRAPAVRAKPRIAKLKSFPAPASGWIANQNLATPNARGADGRAIFGAARLENWFPTATGVRMRGGSQIYATLNGGASIVTALFSYNNGSNTKLFASTADGLHDITFVSSPYDFEFVNEDDDLFVDELGNTIGDISSLPFLDGFLGGNWISVQFATSGGTFLRVVNGVDTPLVFDGTDWGTTPAITGAVDPTTLSYVWAFKNRLFFVERESLDAWYLPVDAIGGDAVLFPLGGVFTRGGSLLFGASWSLDTGGGLSEQCIFVTTEGEVAVYQGSDPGDADTWSKVGVYRIGRPLGAQAHFRAGGDVAVATDIGLVPLSQAIQRDVAALAPAAVSYPIETAWNEAVAERGGAAWHVEVWPTKQMVILSLPKVGDADYNMFVANARTGAWANFKGWDGTCLEVFGDRLFFGSTDGRVLEAEVTGADDGLPFTGTCVPLFDDLKSPASLKVALQAKAVLLAPDPLEDRLSIQADYTLALPSPPDATSLTARPVWGEGRWGESVWGVVRTKVPYQKWRSSPGAGYTLAPALQITSSSVAPLDVELVRIDVTYDVGDVGT